MARAEAAEAFQQFVAVIKGIRTPGSGCPWDLEQDHRTLRPFLIEEAHEVLETIDRGDDGDLCEELGDLLLQIVLHAQIAADRGAFGITDVISGIEKKMVRRHPHVFGDLARSNTAEVVKNWEQIKAAEAAAKGIDSSAAAALDHLPPALPALQRAQRLGEKAARAGIDKPTCMGTIEQAQANFDELKQISESPATAEETASARRSRLERHFGSMLFNLCQLARLLGISAEDSLRSWTQKYVEDARAALQTNEGQPSQMP